MVDHHAEFRSEAAVSRGVQTEPSRPTQLGKPMTSPAACPREPAPENIELADVGLAAHRTAAPGLRSGCAAPLLSTEAFLDGL
jgi:hypothetical protein